MHSHMAMSIRKRARVGPHKGTYLQLITPLMYMKEKLRNAAWVEVINYIPPIDVLVL